MFRLAREAFSARSGLILVALLYLATLAFAIVLFQTQGGVVSDAGWTWQVTPAGVVIRSVDSKGPAATLSPGSRLVSLNGDRRAAEVGPRPWLQTVRPGQTYRVDWETPDHQSHQAELKMGRRLSERDLQMGLCDFFLNLSFAAVGFLVWAAKPKHFVSRWCSISGLLFGFYMIASAIGPLSPQIAGLPLAIYFLLKSVFPFHLVAGCILFSRFPTGDPPSKVWRTGLIAISVLAACLWIVILPQRLFPYLGIEWRLPFLAGLDLNTRPELANVALRHGFIALCGIYLFAAMFSNYRRLTSQAMRLRIQWVMFGAVAGIVPGLLYSLFVSVADAAHWVSQDTIRELVRFYSLPTVTLAAIPISIAYAILRHRLMGIRVAIVSSVQFLFARRLVQAASLLPAVPLSIYFWRHRSEPLATSLSRPSLLIPGALLALTLLMRKELLDACDRLLARLRLDRKRVMDDMLETLFAQHSAADIAATAASRLDRAFRPEHLFVLHCGAQQHVVPPQIAFEGVFAKTLSERGALLVNRALLNNLPEPERAWLTERNIIVAAPIAGELGTQIAGMIVLGEKLSGESYEATDLDLLEDVARQVYLALKMHEAEVDRDRALREREQAEESGRTRTQLLAQVSHELRHPLSGVVGLTGLLLDTPLREDQKEYAELIRRSSEWVVTIANDMLDLAKFDAGRLSLERTEFAWLPMLEDLAMISAERICDKDVEVVLRVDSGTPSTSLGDPARLRQVLFNLLDNAVKFTDKGWVLIHARKNMIDPNKPSLVVSVEDTGPGLPVDRSRLFRPFEQSSTSSGHPGGTGLGLAISKRLVDAMGGELTLDTKSGRGAKFSLSLPLGIETSETDVALQPLRGLRLLCIDPLHVSLQATSSTLTVLGAAVTGLTCDSDLDITARYDAILIAPGHARESVPAIRNCRRMQSGVPVVVLYRGHNSMPEAELEAFGDIHQIRRPASRRNLVRAIERVLSGRRCLPSTGRDEQTIAGACSGVGVLVIDDHPHTLVVMRAILEGLGCLVRTASTPSAGLGIVELGSVDLVLVDGQLPGMDGIEFTLRVRKLEGAAGVTPIVAITGHSSPEWRRGFFEAGADDFLLKPTSAAELRDVIRMRVHPRSCSAG